MRGASGLERAMSMASTLWSFAMFTSSKIGAISNCIGATSLWRVRTGMPSR